MKKLLSFCAVLALLLPTPALAAGNTTTVFEAQCKLPAIDVVIPATQGIFINPYEFPVTMTSDVTDAQIISTPGFIENRSEVPLSVAVTVGCEVDPGSDMRLVTSSTRGESITRKYAFIYFEIQAVSDPDQVTWDSEFDEEKHIVVRDGGSRPRTNMVTIAQADQPEHFCAFRLTGDCVPEPRDGWAESDKMDVSIAFTFTPLPRQEV